MSSLSVIRNYSLVLQSIFGVPYAECVASRQVNSLREGERIVCQNSDGDAYFRPVESSLGSSGSRELK